MLEIINTVFKIATFLFKKNIPRTARRINASKRFIGMLIFDCGLNDIARSRAQNINRNIDVFNVWHEKEKNVVKGV